MSKSTISFDPMTSVAYTVALLQDYDNEKLIGNMPKRNPYINPIIIKLKNGKPLIVSEKIRKEAINKWIKTKNKKNKKNDVLKYTKMEYNLYIYCIIFIILLIYYAYFATSDT
jgi:hypothetical protein